MFSYGEGDLVVHGTDQVFAMHTTVMVKRLVRLDEEFGVKTLGIWGR
jgi:hypothetical protein